ncbi:MAG TPA: ribulose-phosphate 3-epimerase [Myxococcota bacterium]|nr:ribulose-phosphate 3-epimerase [Myxococcota bacterium]HQK51052.1 ribulose-phosphate 3-epimerase [Myxococcota bacterium]
MRVAPSIIAGDQARLGAEVRAITEAGADLVHLDVMDGHFVPNLTLGPGVLKDLRPHTPLPFDVHLMLSNPGGFIDAFVEAGASRIAIHVEVPDLDPVLRRIAERGVQAGLALNPPTPWQDVIPWLGRVDFLLVMTVHPGFYGQALIPDALDKIPPLKQHMDALGRRIPIMVDGGVDPRNIARIAGAGADEVVAGSAVFRSPDYREAIAALREVRS